MVEHRPRPSARVIVLDAAGRVLLVELHDDSQPQPRFWITPGGGIESGESPAEAAARELAEETGLHVQPVALGPVVATSRGEWEFQGEALYTESVHFCLRTDAFVVDEASWTEEERRFLVGWRWWTSGELDTTSEVIFPPELAPLARRLDRGDVPGVPVELPWSH